MNVQNLTIWKTEKKINFNICKINILQFQKLLNILDVQIIAKKWKNKFINKTTE